MIPNFYWEIARMKLSKKHFGRIAIFHSKKLLEEAPKNLKKSLGKSIQTKNHTSFYWENRCNVLQITVPFHGELWSMYTFNGGRFDSFPPYRSAGEEVHTAGFTDIRSSGYHFYDLCPEMRRFHAGMVDRTGE